MKEQEKPRLKNPSRETRTALKETLLEIFKTHFSQNIPHLIIGENISISVGIGWDSNSNPALAVRVSGPNAREVNIADIENLPQSFQDYTVEYAVVTNLREDI